MLVQGDQESTYDNSGGVVIDLQDTVDEKLLSLALDSDTVQNLGEVVRDKTVTGPLREEGDGNNDPHSLKVTPGLEQREVGRSSLGLLFESQSFLDFLVLEFDEGIVRVASTVVLSDNVNSFLISTVVDEPSRGLGDKVDEDELDDGSKSLEDRGDSPRPGALNSESTVGRPTGNDGSEIPRRVVERSDTGSVGRKSELGDQNGASERGDGYTETDKESTGDEHAKVLGSSLDSDTHDRN
jgi:hypothetical protein